MKDKKLNAMTQTITTIHRFSILSFFALFSFLQPLIGQLISPCSLISTDELSDLIEVEGANEFKEYEKILPKEDFDMKDFPAIRSIITKEAFQKMGLITK